MKIVNTLIVIVALAVIGLVGYSFTMDKTGPIGVNDPNQNATTTGPVATSTAVQTYSNAQFNLTLKYPATYEQAEPVGTSTPLVLKTVEKYPFGQEHHALRMIIVSSKAIAEDSAEFRNLLIQSTVFDGSGLNPQNFSEFTKRTLGSNTYYFIQIGRFEGQLQFAYYLWTPNGVLRFDSVSHGVDWTNPELDTEADVGHAAARSILSTVEVVQ